ncbi:adenosylmethionine--8-amino-7-oxononanoate transaminase [Mesonia sp. K7]|uniref:adenosylmethionine--8-amino-7-oxononanoate transaminase n=1 Tax=Mesonia sp. K7 TaxID=2218606 RepID=UPI000DA8B28E|nr:adenosylmethionine--8-amino-7-oxononanoate transaminase [Mesonia sp. K7]PZD78970.1 adenosylmethionine--8-amino-7-oxononanoate transaminase [Mesonia sp. K7]
MSLIEKDHKYIWHPLTQHQHEQPILPIKSAQGVYLEDVNGKKYIDGISSWYTAVYGHCHPKIVEAIQQQVQQLDQVVFAGFTHQPAVGLAEKLIAILPEGQSKVFFNDNGSTATEIGIKMALQYHFNLGNKRTTMLAFENGFHGDTFGAMSVSGLSVYNGAFEQHFIDVKRIPVPTDENIDEIKQQIEHIHQETPIAGFIYEPLVQGAAAMQMHKAEHLDKILAFCKAKEMVLIADEVMTGFGKTGKNFASDHMMTKPDVICLSKALTAGMLPMGATTCSQQIFEAFYDQDIAKGLFHGHTYTANPLACKVASAAIDLLLSDEIQQNIQAIIGWHQAFAKTIEHHKNVKSVRQTGIILAIDLATEFSRYGNFRNKIYHFFLDKGIYLRPLGNTIYILAPYVIKSSEMLDIYNVIEKFLNNYLEDI